jgi:RNA polymerase sigma-70 factor (ECF subfamily)
LNFVRDNKRNLFLQSIGLNNVPEINDQVNSFEQPHEALIEKQKKEILDNAIDSLPKNQRSAFVLNKIEDLSYKEIADVLDISISSVESLLFRAKKNLQQKLLHCYKKSC